MTRPNRTREQLIEAVALAEATAVVAIVAVAHLDDDARVRAYLADIAELLRRIAGVAAAGRLPTAAASAENARALDALLERPAKRERPRLYAVRGDRA